MRQEKVFCDRCKKESTSSYIPLSLKIGKVPDPSGNGYNQEYRDIDLCVSCVTYGLEQGLTTGMFTV